LARPKAAAPEDLLPHNIAITNWYLLDYECTHKVSTRNNKLRDLSDKETAASCVARDKLETRIKAKWNWCMDPSREGEKFFRCGKENS
jgi:hypothetical protein